jgi:hypothetical protein
MKRWRFLIVALLVWVLPSLSADFHDLSPRGFHDHSPTPGFSFLIFYQFSSSRRNRARLIFATEV